MTTTTTRTRRPSKSIEERSEQAEQLHASIADQVDALRDSGAWEQFLTFAASFHSYSFNNVLLILSQCENASQVAGFRKWQQHGRQVRKGERAIKIFGYSTKKVTVENKDGEEEEKRVARFPILSVFDVSQTDVVDAELAAATQLATRLTGDDDHGVIEALTGYLVGEGWQVRTEAMGGGKNGFADPETKSIVLGEYLSPEQAAKTLIHEAAHIVCGHVDDLDEYTRHRGLMETEAESVAYVVAGVLGFDTAAYSIGYIAGWADADTDLIRSTAAAVLKAAHVILNVLSPAEDENEGEGATA
jgi:antirestriction protein ArdC